MRILLLTALLASACAQTIDRVFNLAHIKGEQDINEVATLLRTISDAPGMSTNAARRTISITGTTDQIALVEWLMKRLDQPLSMQQNADSNEYKMSNAGDNIVWLRYVPATLTVPQFQEIATAVRTVAIIRRVFTYNDPRAIAFRGTPDQIALAKWVVAELDKPLDAPRRHSTQDEYRVPAASDDVTRVFYAAHSQSIQEFQEIATLLRTICDIRRLFTYNGLNALVLHGTPDQMKMAEWLFDRVDQPATAKLAGQFSVPKTSDDVIEVFYLPAGISVQDFQQAAKEIRTSTNIRRLFTYNARREIAARGTTDQLARARQMIEQGGW